MHKSRDPFWTWCHVLETAMEPKVCTKFIELLIVLFDVAPHKTTKLGLGQAMSMGCCSSSHHSQLRFNVNGVTLQATYRKGWFTMGEAMLHVPANSGFREAEVCCCFVVANTSLVHVCEAVSNFLSINTFFLTLVGAHFQIRVMTYGKMRGNTQYGIPSVICTRA